MIVCIIAEGSYPYIAGGVSSWTHQIISGLAEVDFKIISIMASRKESIKYQYQIPGNIIELKTIYLDDYLNLKHKRFRKRISLNAEERASLLKLLRIDPNINWSDIVKLISSKKVGSSIDFLQSHFFYNGVIDFYYENYGDENFNTFFWTIRSMLLPFIQLMQESPVEADLYHAVSTGYAGILGVCLKEINQKPLVLTEHGIYAREREEELIKAKWVTGVYKKLWIDFFYFISVAAYKQGDKIIALFERNRQIQLELGASEEKTEIIANGVDLQRFSLTKLPHEGNNLGAILRIVPIKDVATLIRAFKIVKNNLDSVKLYLIGPTDEDPEYYEQCRNLVELLQLEKDVIFTGLVNPEPYMKILDVLILTSISEGQPLVMLEGMAAGIPIVATDVGSCRELLEENEHEGACGFVTNLVSPNETAAKIFRILENQELREEMGKNGKLRVARTYSKEIFLAKYKKVYEETV